MRQKKLQILYNFIVENLLNFFDKNTSIFFTENKKYKERNHC